MPRCRLRMGRLVIRMQQTNIQKQLGKQVRQVSRQMLEKVAGGRGVWFLESNFI